MTVMRSGYAMRWVAGDPPMVPPHPPYSLHKGESTPAAAPADDAPQAELPLMVLPERALKAKRLPKQRGHAAAPGTGPQSETCGSCMHRESVRGGARAFSKCGLMRRNWTHGKASDIARNHPACLHWSAR